MTVRTRKTITDLIQQLKIQEKEIKSQLSDSQRRLNETRDRIATCYWVIEEIGNDVGDYDPQNEEEYRLSREEYQIWKADNPHLTNEQLANMITRNGWLLPLPTEMPRDEWEYLIKTFPNLSGIELENIVRSQGFLVPEFYEGCPCPDCVASKPKPKAKPLPPAKKKSTYQVVKKGKKYVVEKKPTKTTKKGKK